MYRAVFQRKTMNRYPYEGLFVTVVVVAVMIPLGVGLKALAASWPLAWFVGFAVVVIAALLLFGRWLDIRDAARMKSAQQSALRVLDLPRSDYRSSSLPEKQE